MKVEPVREINWVKNSLANFIDNLLIGRKRSKKRSMRWPKIINPLRGETSMSLSNRVKCTLGHHSWEHGGVFVKCANCESYLKDEFGRRVYSKDREDISPVRKKLNEIHRKSSCVTHCRAVYIEEWDSAYHASIKTVIVHRYECPERDPDFKLPKVIKDNPYYSWIKVENWRERQ